MYTPEIAGGYLIDSVMPDFDAVVTERAVIDAEPGAVFDAARDLDFVTVRSPLLSVAFAARDVPARLRGRAAPPPAHIRLAAGETVLPGWVHLGERAGREVTFGAVGRFWKPTIEWLDVEPERFPHFDEPGWGKIACHFLVTPDGAHRSCFTYEIRVATTDDASRRAAAGYWRLIRPFVVHVMRATLRTVAAQTSSTDRGADRGRDAPRHGSEPPSAA